MQWESITECAWPGLTGRDSRQLRGGRGIAWRGRGYRLGSPGSTGVDRLCNGGRAGVSVANQRADMRDM